jgi:hypothetical protein
LTASHGMVLKIYGGALTRSYWRPQKPRCSDNGIKPSTGPRANTRAHIAADPKPGNLADKKTGNRVAPIEVGPLRKLVSDKKLSVSPEKEKSFTDFEKEQKYVAVAQVQTQESFRDTHPLASRLSTYYSNPRTPEDESRDRSDHYGGNGRRSGFADSKSYTPLSVVHRDRSRGRRLDGWPRSRSPLPERASLRELREGDRLDRAWKREYDSYIPHDGDRDRSQDKHRGRWRSPTRREDADYEWERREGSGRRRDRLGRPLHGPRTRLDTT